MFDQFAGCRKKFPLVHLIFCVVSLLSFQIRSHASENVALSWAAANNPAVTGFHVYYGTASRSYSNILTVGNTSRAVISGLTFGTVYYVAVSELDSRGHESALSAEITFQAGSAMLTSANIGGQRFSFNLQGSTGQQYVILSSTNFLDWTPCFTNTAPFQYSIPVNQAIPRLAFRAYRSQ
jgi:hypothetical protein